MPSPRHRLVAVLAAVAMAWVAPAEAAEAERVSVVTTIAPLAMIVQDLGGDRVAAGSLVSGASSPHSYEPAPSDLVRISQADLLVSVGGDLDGWLDKLAVGRKQSALVLKLAGDAETAADHGDPHVWLDPRWVRDTALPSLVRALSAVDPSSAARYQAACAREGERLTDLEAQIRTTLAVPVDRAFVAFHPAWGRFAARFDLREIGAVEEIGGVEPSAAALASLLDAAREAGVGAILIEPQMDPRIARSLASEIGAELVLVDPLGSLGSAERGSYHDLMMFNARAFARAMLAASSDGGAVGSALKDGR